MKPMKPTLRNDDDNVLAMVLDSGYTPPKQIVKHPKSGHVFDVYFDEPIEDPCMFRELFQTIHAMTSDDELHLHMSCSGGDLNTTIQIYNELLACRGKTVAHLYHAFSAATFLVLVCDEIKVYDYSTFMCHNVAYGVQGKGSEAKTMVNFINRTSETLLRDFYKEFLTTDEIERIIKDEDFWFDADEIIVRLQGWKPRRTLTRQKPHVWSTDASKPSIPSIGTVN